MQDYENASEQTLVKWACKNDTHAFSKLYENVYKELYRFALYTLKHPQDAEDVVSETVISAYEYISSLRKTEAFRGWIFKIVANACKKKLLTYKTRSVELEEAAWIIETDYAQAQDVREAYHQLDYEDRLIISLSIFAGYNSMEIGEMLELNANTIRSKRSRALGKLERILTRTKGGSS